MPALAFRIIGELDADENKDEKLYDVILHGAQNVIGTGEEHAPMLFILTAQGEFGVAPVTMSKNDLAKTIKALAADPKMRAVVSVMEAWMSPALKSPHYQYKHVEDDPGRREVLMVNLLTRKRQAVMTCPIDRKTKTLTKVPFQWIDEGEPILKGRFIR